MKRVNAFEAKTRFSELLRETEKGESFLICRRGKEVALLVPFKRESEDLRKILSSFQEVRNKIRGRINVRELIEEGRRY